MKRTATFDKYLVSMNVVISSNDKAMLPHSAQDVTEAAIIKQVHLNAIQAIDRIFPQIEKERNRLLREKEEVEMQKQKDRTRIQEERRLERARSFWTVMTHWHSRQIPQYRQLVEEYIKKLSPERKEALESMVKTHLPARWSQQDVDALIAHLQTFKPSKER